MTKKILDVCCGSKMFWFNKDRTDTVYMDNRVLEANGILVFKWNEEQIKLNEILKLTDVKALFGNKRAKTHWLVFMKEEQTNDF